MTEDAGRYTLTEKSYALKAFVLAPDMFIQLRTI
jgi:hypothetical protein